MTPPGPDLESVADLVRTLRQALSDAEWRGDDEKARALAAEYAEVRELQLAGHQWRPKF